MQLKKILVKSLILVILVKFNNLSVIHSFSNQLNFIGSAVLYSKVPDYLTIVPVDVSVSEVANDKGKRSETLQLNYGQICCRLTILKDFTYLENL